MLHAVSYAFADSFNALLIGILVAIGIMLPRGQYRRIAPLVVVGDWLGVLAAAAAVLYIFLGFQDSIKALLEGPIMGIVLIVVGLAVGVGAWRSGGKSNDLVGRLLGPLREPTPKTALLGFAMGVIQSLTSVPFYGGLIYMAAGDYSRLAQWGGLLWYATLALSLPTACGLFIAVVRARPQSAAGRLFARARANSEKVALIGGYVVAAFLVIMGAVAL